MSSLLQRLMLFSPQKPSCFFLVSSSMHGHTQFVNERPRKSQGTPPCTLKPPVASSQRPSRHTGATTCSKVSTCAELDVGTWDIMGRWLTMFEASHSHSLEHFSMAGQPPVKVEMPCFVVATTGCIRSFEEDNTLPDPKL